MVCCDPSCPYPSRLQKRKSIIAGRCCCVSGRVKSCPSAELVAPSWLHYGTMVALWHYGGTWWHYGTMALWWQSTCPQNVRHASHRPPSLTTGFHHLPWELTLGWCKSVLRIILISNQLDLGVHCQKSSTYP